MTAKLSNSSVIFSFSKNNKPLLTVSNGDTVQIETLDCFSNQIQNKEDKLETMNWDRVNPATGPVFINGAEPGDVLKVTINKIQLKSQGVVATGENLGVLGDKIKGLKSRIVKIENNAVIFDSKVTLLIKPMIGVIGVAPSGEPVNCGTPGIHGGNMDNTMIGEGASVYFSVFAEGALFALGDMHAVMGDGEIGGSGVEVAGTAEVKFEVIKNLIINNPIVENSKYLCTVASDTTLDSAAAKAVSDMAELVAHSTSLKLDEISLLFSIAGNAEICQVVDPLKTARFLMPKDILDKYSFKLV
ncbi:MAG: Acetamidase/Formamidase [Clostridiaceae bacterium]|jgi:amidase|nr:Acetamidase/Formamidase [Clostridiaceae bacterium]